MKHYLHNTLSSSARIPTRQLADGFRQSLNKSYGRVFSAAQAQWEQKFAGKEPSDACVRVRITTAPRLNRFELAPDQYASIAA